MTAARSCLRALLAALLAVVAVGVLAPAAHADNGLLIDVSLTSVSTPILDLSDPDQVVELGGTLVNTSSTRIRFVAVNFWQSSDPITTPDALAATLTLPADRPIGRRTLPNDEASGNVQVITRDEWFEPGARAQFSVRATVTQLKLADPDAIYLLGVQVRGIAESSSGRTTVGRGRLLTLATTQPLSVSVVSLLSAPPTQLAGGDFIDDSLSGELGGRLSQLLGVAERTGGTILVDPALVAEAEALSGPHTVGGRESSGDPVARNWVDRVRSLAAAGRALRLPFGDPALARADAEGTLDAVLARSAAAPLPAFLDAAPSAADVGDQATDRLLAGLSTAGIGTVFADNVNGTGGALVQVSPMDSPGMGPGDATNDVQIAGRRLAEEFLSPTPRTYLIRDAADIRTLGVLGGHHTVVPVRHSTLPTDLLPPGPPPAAWQRLTERITGLSGEADFLFELTGIDSRTNIEIMATKAWSASFTTQKQALDYVQAHPIADLDPGRVSVTAAKQFVMGSRTNEFPVTITNDLTVPVTVRLTFDSEAPQRLHIPDTEPITVQPGESQTLNVSPEATSNGIVTVHGRLETTAGTPFGDEVTIEITATELGSVAWIVIIVSGVVVLGGTFARIRAVQSGRARKESS